MISAMNSAMDEKVQFLKPVYPFGKVMKEFRVDLKGNIVNFDTITENSEAVTKTRIQRKEVEEVRPVEEWLDEVQSQMCNSLRDNIVRSQVDY